MLDHGTFTALTLFGLAALALFAAAALRAYATMAEDFKDE